MTPPNELEWSVFAKTLRLPSPQRDAILTAWLGDGWSPFAIQGEGSARPMDVAGGDYLEFLTQAIEPSRAREMASECGAPSWEQRAWMINALRVGTGVEPDQNAIRWLLGAQLDLSGLGSDLAGAGSKEAVRALITAGAGPEVFGGSALRSAAGAIKALAMSRDAVDEMRALGDGLGKELSQELINLPGSFFKEGEEWTPWSSIRSWGRVGMADLALEWGARINFEQELERLKHSDALASWFAKRAPFELAGRSLIKASWRQWASLLEDIWGREDCGGDGGQSEAFKECAQALRQIPLEQVWAPVLWDSAPFKEGLALCEARALSAQIDAGAEMRSGVEGVVERAELKEGARVARATASPKVRI